MKNTLRELRKKRGFTQEKLAEHAGCSGQMISGIETGETLPSEELLKKISAILKCRPEDIFQDYQPGVPLVETIAVDVMEVRLSKRIAPLVEAIEKAGGYGSAEEVLNEAVRKRYEELRQLGLIPPHRDSGTGE